jgi:hypothetical protein
LEADWLVGSDDYTSFPVEKNDKIPFMLRPVWNDAQEKEKGRRCTIEGADDLLSRKRNNVEYRFYEVTGGVRILPRDEFFEPKSKNSQDDTFVSSKDQYQLYWDNASWARKLYVELTPTLKYTTLPAGCVLKKGGTEIIDVEPGTSTDLSERVSKYVAVAKESLVGREKVAAQVDRPIKVEKSNDKASIKVPPSYNEMVAKKSSSDRGKKRASAARSKSSIKDKQGDVSDDTLSLFVTSPNLLSDSHDSDSDSGCTSTGISTKHGPYQVVEYDPCDFVPKDPGTDVHAKEAGSLKGAYTEGPDSSSRKKVPAEGDDMPGTKPSAAVKPAARVVRTLTGTTREELHAELFGSSPDSDKSIGKSDASASKGASTRAPKSAKTDSSSSGEASDDSSAESSCSTSSSSSASSSNSTKSRNSADKSNVVLKKTDEKHKVSDGNSQNVEEPEEVTEAEKIEMQRE